MDAPNGLAPLPFPPPPVFDDFIQGENHRPLAALRLLTQGRGLASSVYLFGRGGCGKTHLLRLAAAQAKQRGMPAFYVGKGGTIPPPMPGLLAADNIDEMPPAARLLLFDWQNRLRPGAPYRIVCAGRLPPQNMATKAGEEIAARLSAGLSFCIREISEDEKRRALSAYARRRGFALPEGVAALFLSRLPRDMASLMSALSALDCFLLARQKPLTLPLARLWLHYHSPALFE